jgi:hypothetical protein
MFAHPARYADGGWQYDLNVFWNGGYFPNSLSVNASLVMA